MYHAARHEVSDRLCEPERQASSVAAILLQHAGQLAGWQAHLDSQAPGYAQPYQKLLQLHRREYVQAIYIAHGLVQGQAHYAHLKRRGTSEGRWDHLPHNPSWWGLY